MSSDHRAAVPGRRSPHSKRTLAIVEVLVAVIVGSLLYMLTRPDGLIAFGWVRAIGLGEALATARAAVLPFASAVPSFVRFSVPDGLWAFAFTRAMVLVWSAKWSRASAPWILLAPIVAIGSELGQAMHVVAGTFDVVDLLCVTLGSVFALAFSIPRTTLCKSSGVIA